MLCPFCFVLSKVDECISPVVKALLAQQSLVNNLLSLQELTISNVVIFFLLKIGRSISTAKAPHYFFWQHVLLHIIRLNI